VLADIIPIRDIFATLFFRCRRHVDRSYALIAQWQLVRGSRWSCHRKLLITVALLAAVSITGTARWPRCHGADGLSSASSGRLGVRARLIDIGQYGTILSIALCSILALPILVLISPRLVLIAERLPGWNGRSGEPWGRRRRWLPRATTL
jgi:hypothetical protein